MSKPDNIDERLVKAINDFIKDNNFVSKDIAEYELSHRRMFGHAAITAHHPLIAQIKQVFKDEGYIRVYETTLAPGVSEGYVIIPAQPMTGEEWLKRFEKEFYKICATTLILPEHEMKQILEAAKRASGVE